MAAVFSGKPSKECDGAGNTLLGAFIFRTGLSCLVSCWLAGCSALGGAVPSRSSLTSPVKFSVGDVVETSTCKVITSDELLGGISGASIVYAGETHTSVEAHKTQLDIVRKLFGKGQCMEIGMEMFPRSAQPVLDRYIGGQTTEEEFLKEVHWDQVWGFPYPLYRGLMDFAREHGIRVIGLNAPHPVVSKIAHSGLNSLSPEERDQVAGQFHLDDPKNRARIEREYGMHGKEGIGSFEFFFQAQLAWEETMAQTLVERLRATGGKCRIVAIIGEGHISDRLGVPYLASLRTQHGYKTVTSVPFDYPSSACDPDLADYVVITEKWESEDFHRPRLGVTIQPAESGEGVEILGVLQNSPAAASGLRKGDIILSVNGKPVRMAEEVQKAIAEEGPSYKILILRGKSRITIEVTIAR